MKKHIRFLWIILFAGCFGISLGMNGFCADGVIVKNITAQIAEKGSENHSITVSAFVTNQTASNNEIVIDIVAVDKEGYQLESITLRGNVKQGKTRVLMGMMEISTGLYDQIEGWELKP